MSIPISKRQIKYIRSLKLSKFRQMYNNFVAEGEKIVSEVIDNSTLEIEYIVCSVDWYEKNQRRIDHLASKILIAKKLELEQVTSFKNPPAVLAVIKQIETIIDDVKSQERLILFLDGIQDPGNLGTIIRTADWFGIKHVVTSLTSADLYNPKVIQSTMGAFQRVSVMKMEFLALKQLFPKSKIYGTSLVGISIYEQQLAPSGIIVIGNEGKGISQDVLRHITDPIKIPQYDQGGGESLNAAVATGIVCAAFRR